VRLINNLTGKVSKMVYIIVGFKVNQENSVYYSKAKTKEELCAKVLKAFEKGAEFISLRRVL